MLNKKALAATAAGAEPVYVEDVFQSWLRTGTGADTTVTTNIDMTEGYMLWSKGRSGATDHAVYDSARGVTKDLVTNSTAAETTQSTGLKAVSSTGYTVGSLAKMNTSGAIYVDWTFRKAPKFFDVVTYTGDGVAGRQIAHNLGSVPGFIIVKVTSTTNNWTCQHRSYGGNYRIELNNTDAIVNESGYTGATSWNKTNPTSDYFVVGSDTSVNASGQTYVAYLFAHDAGGFGDDGSQNVISCGSFVAGSSGTTQQIDLGFEPQWVLVRNVNDVFYAEWRIYDTMRGMSETSSVQLKANSSDAEETNNPLVTAYSQGFKGNFSAGGSATNDTFIYIAIRRGPMKTPESGTEVFEPVTYTKTNTDNRVINTTITPDLVYQKVRTAASFGWAAYDRIRGSALIQPNSTIAQSTSVSNEGFSSIAGQNGVVASTTSDAIMNDGSANAVLYAFKRAPQFLDVIFISATGFTASSSHNLTVVPELVIQKNMDGSDWRVAYNIASGGYSTLVQNDTSAGVSRTYGNGYMLNSQPTSTSIAFDNTSSGQSYVAYLFASVSGVSKVGSYTGNGSSQTINCGFTAGARFVLLKSTSTTGNWVVFDSARGIVSGNDPYLLLNSTAAEVTDKDAVDTDNTGFVVNETTGPNVNTNGASYIFLAVS